MAKAKSVFFCSECGHETIKWQGQCPACKNWNSIVEHREPKSKQNRSTHSISLPFSHNAVMLSDVDISEETRFRTGMAEFDRVLGGGAVKGSLVLVGGSPGIGKSTLLLQLCGYSSGEYGIMYVSGEESGRQIKIRAERLEIASTDFMVLTETNLGGILDAVNAEKPDILIVDSIQTLFNESIESAPGSISQVRDCTMSLMQLAKTNSITVFIIGHVNKEGSIAGPKILEHMVDCVLYFEGEQNANYRILRAAKNRFGSTNEIGVFEMTEQGLADIPNPSEMLLAGRPIDTSGTCVTCIMEGSRPILAEIQALITPTSFNVPRRTSNGIDYNRAVLLLAVLEKRGGLKLNTSDAYINVIGGLSIEEPAADLAVILALASSYLDRPITSKLAALGEVGLSGELRSVTAIDQRLSEARRLGFEKCIVPIRTKGKYRVPEGLDLVETKSIREALSITLGRQNTNL